jgi:hypothetical protein
MIAILATLSRSLPMDDCHFGYIIKKFITKTPIQHPNPRTKNNPLMHFAF